MPQPLLAFPGAPPASAVAGDDQFPTLLTPDLPVGNELTGSALPAVTVSSPSPLAWVWFLAWMAAVFAVFIVLALIATPPGI